MVPFFRLALLLFLCSCSLNDGQSDLQIPFLYQVEGERYKFTADPRSYQEIDFNRARAAFCGIEMELKRISRRSNMLTLEILKPKDCDATYELVWDGKWQDSSPRRIQVYLGGVFPICSSTGEMESDTIQVDLAKALQPSGKFELAPFSIYIREQCNFRDYHCVGDCDLVNPG